MRYAIEITDMDEAELRAVTAAITALGATPRTRTSAPATTPASTKTAQTVAELAHATGAQQQPAPPPGFAPPPPAPQYQPPAPMAPQGAQQPPASGTALAPTAGVDGKGIAHNPEFHAPSGRKTNDNRWALKKGVNREAWEAWEAQQLAAPGAPVPTPPPAPAAPTPPVMQAPAAHQPTTAEINAKFAPHLPAQGQTEAPPAPAAPTGAIPNGHALATPGSVDPFAAAAPAATPQPPAPAAPTPPAPVSDEPIAYSVWHGLYTNLMTSGKMSPEQYEAIAEKYGGTENPYIFYSDETKRTASYRDMLALTTE